MNEPNRAVKELRAAGELTASQLRDRGVPRANHWLKKLRGDGAVEVRRAGRAAVWRLSDAMSPGGGGSR